MVEPMTEKKCYVCDDNCLLGNETLCFDCYALFVTKTSPSRILAQNCYVCGIFLNPSETVWSGSVRLCRSCANVFGVAEKPLPEPDIFTESIPSDSFSEDLARFWNYSP